MVKKLEQLIRKSGALRPPLSLLYGDPGVGKSTCAARARDALVMRTEDGLGLIEVDTLPLVETYPQAIEWINALIESESTDHRTLVIDSVDGLEELCAIDLCQRHGKDSLADFQWGKGFAYLSDAWIDLLRRLQALRDRHSMQIILIAHAARVTVESLTDGSFERYEPNLHKRITPLVTKWADLIGFLEMERTTKTVQGSRRDTKTSVTTGQRILHVEDNGSFIAKNRFGFPSEIPIGIMDGWGVVESHLSARKNSNNKEAA